MYPVERCGDRVRLRELERDDVDAVHRWVGDPDAVRFVPLGPLDRPATVRYVDTVIREAAEQPRDTYTLGVVERASGELVGTVAIGIDSRAHRRAELGYILRRDAWGRGLATEAASLALRLAFEDLSMMRVWAVCDPENPASAAVLRRIGMVPEGRLRRDLCIRGEWRDSLLFAVLAPDREGDRGYL